MQQLTSIHPSKKAVVVTLPFRFCRRMLIVTLIFPGFAALAALAA
jgi:hypothetical protein